MEKHFEKYFVHMSRREDGEPCVSSADHEQMGFGFRSCWIREPQTILAEETAYAFDVLYVFVGQDRENDKMLCGELSFNISGYTYTTDRTCMILIPGNTPHGPVCINRTDSPFFFYMGAASKELVPEGKNRWIRPEEVSFERYVLHANGIDNNEAEHEVLRLHGTDNEMVSGFGGVFYGKFRWFKVTTPEDFVFAAESHTHSQPEMLNWYGTDPDHPEDLGAEIEMGMLDETYVSTESTSLFVPANQPHCPLKIRKVTRPFMFFTLMPDCKVYQLENKVTGG